MNLKLKILVSMVIVVFLLSGCNIESDTNLSDIKNNNQESINNLVKLNLGQTRNITGGLIQKINDYEFIIPEKLVKVGYSINIENDILTIASNDNNYKFVMYQLTDKYIMPTQSEIDAFYESEEHLKLEQLYYDDNISLDDYLNKSNELKNKYFKKLGYNEVNSPNYVMSSDKLDKYRKEYLLTGDKGGSGSNYIFPGYQYYTYYDWGKHVIYAIPKEQEHETFGKDESEFSAYIETFEYFNNNIYNYDINLYTL